MQFEISSKPIVRFSENVSSYFNELILHFAPNSDRHSREGGNPLQTTQKPINIYIMNNQFYVYILANTHNTTLYIGMTNNLERRVYEHKTHLNKGFTYKYNVDKLVWYDVFSNADSAILREKQLKKWNRAWKERIINEMNPEWRDLSESWSGGGGGSRLRGNDEREGTK